jgi:hypothetical protein
MTEPYLVAQRAMADLKSAIYLSLKQGPSTGMRNADIGRALGIYSGHVEHEGHIPRTLLAIMEKEGVVAQDIESKLWTLKNHCAGSEADNATGNS